MSDPSIAVITPWLNHLELAPDYLDAMESMRDTDQLLVVDSASDPPVEFAAIRLDENLGFSGGNNIGLRAAETDAVLFLNSDIVALSPDWLDQIRAALEPGVLLGAELRFDLHGQVDGMPMPYLDGWCVAGFTEEIRDMGGWDEEFGKTGYYGDNEFSFRARVNGMTLRELRLPLKHLRNGTMGPPSPEIQQITLENKAKFEARVRDALGAAA